ncbi:hypothetical protein CERSUDRAFT_63568 [Gelatoporia subvermispora B]|uniref:EF-hand domain-containing protein n=1 Tax=Ceriporiopsis subvermispora (strain B) TaxID=914234 RepID=M2PTN2_CERS8|nr:hypothetical protein CERSUDRAFT_63568 [Gelatoporia subvermispora B]
MNLLDKLAEVHPASKLAFALVKTAFELYLARRDNDQRVQILYFRMNEISGLFRELLDIQVLTDTLKKEIEQIAHNIRACSEACDAYYKTPTVVKLLRANAWARELTAYLALFDGQERRLTQALSTEANKKLDNLQVSILKIESSLDEMFTIFRDKFLSPGEDALRKELTDTQLESQQDLESMLRKLVQKELKGNSKSPNSRGTTVTDQKLESLKVELLEDTKETIRKNGKEFQLKFDAALRKQTEQLTRTIQDNGDRIIDRIANKITRNQQRLEQTLRRGQRNIEQVTESISTPYKKINNPHKGWTGHAESRQFVMALRDYFNGNLVEVKKSTIRGDATSNQIARDEWALAYISPKWQHRIMEAIDDDASGYVTVAELNKFMDALPKELEWSLPCWLAYWAVGWQMSSSMYMYRIRGILADMLSTLTELSPENRDLGDQYFDDVWQELLPLIASLESCPTSKALQQRFESYVKSEEKLLDENLKEVQYNIDAIDTLQVNIIGGGRIEKYIFSLMYLLLKRHLQVLRGGRLMKLDEEELETCVESVQVCMKAMNLRISDLTEYFQIQERKVDLQSQFETTACGTFKYLYNSQDLWTAEQVESHSVGDFDRVHAWEEIEEMPTNDETPSTPKFIGVSKSPTVSSVADVEGPHHRFDCDSCSKTIVGERYICVACFSPQDDVRGTVDFCNNPECFRPGGRSLFDPRHTQDHGTLLKVRYYLHWNDHASVLRLARSVAERCRVFFEESALVDIKRSEAGDAPELQGITHPLPQENGEHVGGSGVDGGDNKSQGSSDSSAGGETDESRAIEDRGCAVCRKPLLSPPCWVCLKCTGYWIPDYFLCDECESNRLLACHSCGTTYEQPSWYFGYKDDDPFMCQSCIREGKSGDASTDWHIYTHPLLRYHHTAASMTDCAASVMPPEDQLAAVHQDMKIVQDKVESLQEKMAEVQEQMRRMEEHFSCLVAKFESPMQATMNGGGLLNGQAGSDQQLLLE